MAANILTAARIICGILLLAFPAFSKGYYLLYLLGGFTDVADGAIARKQGKATSSGAKFDTAADFVFVLAVVIKIAVSVVVPKWLLIWVIIIAVIKTAGIAAGAIRHHRIIPVHSVLNKVCGITVFIPPLFIGAGFAWQAKALVTVLACIVASTAAVQEFVFIWKGKNIE